MKSHWQRGAEFLVLDIKTLNALIQPAFPGRQVEDARPVEGGLSNTNYRLMISGRGFASHGGTLVPQWKRACRLLDLINWVSFLNRPAPGGEVIESSRAMILRTMNSWRS